MQLSLYRHVNAMQTPYNALQHRPLHAMSWVNACATHRSRQINCGKGARATSPEEAQKEARSYADNNNKKSKERKCEREGDLQCALPQAAAPAGWWVQG